MPRGRVLAALVLGAQTVALFLAYYTLGLRDRIAALEQSSMVRASALQVFGTVRAVVPAWLLQSFHTFISTVGLAQVFGEISRMGATLRSGTGSSALGGATVAPAYFAVRRILRPLPRAYAQPFRPIHWRIRLAKAPASGPALPFASAAG